MKIQAILIACVIALATSAPSKIDPALRMALKQKSTANVFVSFQDGTHSVLKGFKLKTFATRGQKLTSLKNALEENSAVSQKSVLEFLTANHNADEFKSFWINNQVFVKNAPLSLVEKLAQFPEVSEIVEEEYFEVVAPVESITQGRGPTPMNEWGVSLIQAPEAWGLDGGNNGAGVRVATIDTGVRYTHEALAGNFLGDFGWYDPYAFTLTPNDQNGHGTHTTGTIAGQGGIGVAPGSKWMACKGCATAMCAQDALISCGQWMLCPTSPTGDQSNCDLAPHLVSNSWGGGRGRDMFYAVIDSWNAGGIIGVFANGNSGPSCNSANSPADHSEVIAVGSTTNTDAISSFSSVGPSFWGEIKPDVSAPGSSVLSAYHTADDAYSTLSGTSMACPHAAGVIALLHGRNPDLTYSDIWKHLTVGSVKTGLIGGGKNCGNITEDVFPNHAFGHGRINALNSLLSLIAESS